MREASPFESIRHTHTGLLYLYETWHVALSSNPGYEKLPASCAFLSFPSRPGHSPAFSRHPLQASNDDGFTGGNPRYRFESDVHKRALCYSLRRMELRIEHADDPVNNPTTGFI